VATRVILTATAHQARFLRDRWSAQQLQSGQTAWETPEVLSVQAWMRQQWSALLQQGVDLPLLLNPDQERSVWQQLLPALLSEPSQFLRQRGLVDHALRANQQFSDWHEDGEQLEQILTGDQREEIELFNRWQQQFRQQCEENHWIGTSALAAQLLILMREGGLALPTEVACYHRALWNQAEQRLVRGMAQLGTCVSEYSVGSKSAKRSVVACTSPDLECRAVADAVAQQIRQHPDQRLGVVVPGLASRRVGLERHLSEVLVPESAVVPIPEQRRPFRISQGGALIDDPRIDHAFQLLRLACNGLPLLEAAALLRSPWLLLGEEMAACARQELELRRWGGETVTLSALVQFLQSSDLGERPVRFLGAMEHVQQIEWGGVRSTDQWAERFTSTLACFEWAENGALSQTALAAYNQWRAVLDRFVSLDRIVGAVDRGRALSELQQILSGTPLEVGRAERSLAVVTPEQAVGVQFDWLWVMECDDQSWPQRQIPSPFLPHQWQRERLPGVDPHQAQQRDMRQFQQFCDDTVQLVFSYSRSEDGAASERNLSPLIDVSSIQVLEDQSLSHWWVPQQQPAQEEIQDQLEPLPWGTAVRGGSALLGNQSQCPFRAFVRHRLHADPIGPIQQGLDARERGTLLHELLERCWREIGQHSSRLLQMDEQILQGMVEKLAAGVVERFREAHQQRVGRQFSENERHRLSRMASRFLQIDRQREISFEVEALERQYRVEIGGIELSTKMDRVDRLEDGHRLVIDYKSGKVSGSDWEGARPRVPQLPLYAVMLEQVAAVLYGQLRADEVGYRGAQQDQLLAGVSKRHCKVDMPEAWQQQLAQWHEAVERLATEFRNGISVVAPLDGAVSCQHCGLQPLCRVEFS